MAEINLILDSPRKEVYMVFKIRTVHDSAQQSPRQAKDGVVHTGEFEALLTDWLAVIFYRSGNFVADPICPGLGACTYVLPRGGRYFAESIFKKAWR